MGRSGVKVRTLQAPAISSKPLPPAMVSRAAIIRFAENLWRATRDEDANYCFAIALR
jgi:hypothetical protein